MFPKNASEQCIVFLEQIEEILGKWQPPLNTVLLQSAIENTLGIKIKIWLFHSTTSFLGRVYPSDKNELTVMLKSDMNPYLFRFVFCHEIAHVIHSFKFPSKFEWPRQLTFKGGSSRYDSPEVQICDDIAMRLLLPEVLLKNWFNKHLSFPFQGNIFQEEYPEKYCFFKAVEIFQIPPKELAMYIKQITLGISVGSRSDNSWEEIFSRTSLKECISKLKTQT